MSARPFDLVFPATGVAWLAAVAISPDTGHTSAADRYAGISAHQTAFQLATVLFLVAGIGIAACGMAAFGHRSSGRGAGATRVGAGLLAVASAWLIVAYTGFYAGVLSLLQQGASRATTYRFIDHDAGPWGHVFDLTLLAFLLAPILLAVGLRRAGRTTWLPLALWVVGFVLDGAFEFSAKPGAVAGVALCTAALTLLGRALGTVSEPSSPRPQVVSV